MNNLLNARLRTLVLPVAVVTSIGMAGCSSSTGRGAAVGAAAGGVLGGVIGNNTGSGSTTKGAIIGAVLGGAAGAAIGRRMDDQAEELDDIEGAEVERVGEGINITFDSGILFDVDSDRLRNESRANLMELSQSLRDYPGTRVLVAGHTDADGTDSYNQSLSERRASAAKSFLVSQGIEGSRIDAVGRGESEPVADNSTAMGKQENRRVEVAIFASDEMRQAMLERYGRN